MTLCSINEYAILSEDFGLWCRVHPLKTFIISFSWEFWANFLSFYFFFHRVISKDHLLLHFFFVIFSWKETFYSCKVLNVVILVPVLFKTLTILITVSKELDQVVFFTEVRLVLYFSDSSNLQMGYVLLFMCKSVVWIVEQIPPDKQGNKDDFVPRLLFKVCLNGPNLS